MQAIKLRLEEDTLEKLRELHPSYGEVQKVIRELVEEYVKNGGRIYG